MAFNQPPPQLGNQYDDDRALRSLLARVLPAEVLRAAEPRLRALGELAGGALYVQQLAERTLEPKLTQWDAWGNRIDHIELTPLWQRARELSLQHGLIATGYEREFAEYSRMVQYALAYLFGPSTDVYNCPLAMTDGAAKVLLAAGNAALIERVVPRLTSRDPARAWTSGQWMTESTGGSDVGLSETVARRDDDGVWRLFGRKWFTSAATSDIALTLARPEGNSAGGRGLALFHLETRDAEGNYNGISVHRLKEKLGTRKVPTAELTLDGTRAELVAGEDEGVRNIAPMLNITRLWNSVSAVGFMRRAVALARDYAHRRMAFGAALAQKPLHVDTLAGLQAETEAALHLTFFVAELLGREECSLLRVEEQQLLRALTPIAKLTTGKQVVSVVSEAIECFGGAGYVEDTGLPQLLRDAQVLPIWEGTTNVLALDFLRTAAAAQGPLRTLIQDCCASASDERLRRPMETIQATLQRSLGWLNNASAAGMEQIEAGARRYALTVGRTLAAALLCRHAQWSLERESDARAALACRRFVANGIDLLSNNDLANSRALALDERPVAFPGKVPASSAAG
jgi:alkylation response protein AidB-like acyl-CoA dehydrogenase